MGKGQRGSLNPIRHDGLDQAVLFLHGFSGDRDDTWDGFPALLGTHVPDCDIFTLGYATTFLPDVGGVWSADPDLPIVATMVRTELDMDPLDRYGRIAFVAHSMGGLIVQKALVDDPGLADRTSHVILFGTPSAGVRKASWFRWLKPQLRNMVEGSDFIVDLREKWRREFEPEPAFRLMIVAGSKDQFVQPSSSLDPFDPRFHRVVKGDHLQIVKPKAIDAPSFRLLRSALTADEPAPDEASDPIVLAAERTTSDVDVAEIAARHDPAREVMTEKEVVDLALALEREGKRDEAIALLEKHRELGPDVYGTLGGRTKRIWIEDEEEEHARRAFDLYGQGLALATHLLGGAETEDQKAYAHGQIYYHAINRAFFHFVVFDEPDKAREMAELATKHARAEGETVWSLATRAEAQFYLGDPDAALAGYEKMLALGGGEGWQHASAGLQATQIAAKLEDEELAERIARLFTPETRRVNRIFVSYSHKDQEWMDRLEAMAKPLLRTSGSELDFWVDTRIRPGEQWDKEIKQALSEAGVAVALVSANFLASEYVWNYEMPEILDAARDGSLTLLWAYLSPAYLEATKFQDFQATHDIARPLATLPPHEQDAVLVEVVRQMKEATLSATERFRAQ